MSSDPSALSAATLSFTGVFLLSLVGSAHCAGMCGGFVALFGGRAESSAGTHVAYHVGRMVTYTILGAVAGIFGAGLDHSGGLIGLQRGAALLTACLFLVWGGAMLFERRSAALVPPPGAANCSSAVLSRGSPGLLRRLSFGLYRKVIGSGIPPTRQALLLGLLSGALPCGWLWGFLLLAAGTGSPGSGALVMFSFWLGTVPILLGVGVVSRGVTSLRFLRGRLATGLVLLVAGLFSLFLHTKPLIAQPEPHAGQHVVEGGVEHNCH